MLGLGNSIITGGGVSGVIAPVYSLSLDGANDRVTFTETSFPIAADGNDGSISFWAKRTDNDDEATVLGHSGNAFFKRFVFVQGTGMGDKLEIESDQNGQTASGPVTADTDWHHYVFTWAGNSSGTAAPIIYEDGSAVSTASGNFGVQAGEDFTIDNIGSSGGLGNDKEYKGLLYQIAIWDETLDADAVAAVYNSGTPIALQENKGNYDNSGDLIHLWRFDEGTGSSAADSIGSLTGALQENAAFSSTTPS